MSLTWFLEYRRDDSRRKELIKRLKMSEQEPGRVGHTYFEGPSGSMFVVVADSLQLTASSELPDDKLETTPQTLAVEEHEKLGHHSVEVGGQGRRRRMGRLKMKGKEEEEEMEDKDDIRGGRRGDQGILTHKDHVYVHLKVPLLYFTLNKILQIFP